MKVRAEEIAEVWDLLVSDIAHRYADQRHQLSARLLIHGSSQYVYGEEFQQPRYDGQLDRCEHSLVAPQSGRFAARFALHFASSDPSIQPACMTDVIRIHL